MNVAFDANIWVSFTIGKQLNVLSSLLLDEAYSKGLNIHGCSEILAEYVDVVKRPKLRKYVKPERIQETLDLIARVTETHHLTRVVVGSRDSKDNYLLSLAETVPLDYLVTGDRDLLVLEHWQQTRISSFAEFVKLIGPASETGK